MIQPGCDGNLAEEAVSPQRGYEFGPEDLDRHMAAMFEVLGEVDRGHATGPQFPLDGVAVGEGGF